MKIWIFITAISFLFVIYLLNKGRKDAAKEPANGTIITYPDQGEVFMENDIDEFSPENLDIDSSLSAAILRAKLTQIEKERD